MERLIKKIKEFEGLALTPYRCPGGAWTIGYGHRCAEGQPPISLAEANRLLLTDVLNALQYVLQLTEGCGLEAHQVYALTDFVFNLGANALKNSTLLKRIRRGDSMVAVCGEIRRWRYAAGKELPGLVKRREWEAAFYKSKKAF